MCFKIAARSNLMQFLKCLILLAVKRFKFKLSRQHKKYLKKSLPIIAGTFLLYLLISYLMLPDCKELKTKNPTYSSLMQQQIDEAESEGRVFKISHKFVPLSSISPDLMRAVILGEDFDFFGHDGFDFTAFKEALLEAWLEFRLPRGASTITQQLAKNLYLNNSWSILRKFKEYIIAGRLEKELSKKRILELYLNYIEWGEGVFGAEAAARHYFQESAADLSSNEAAFLAAIVPSPLGAFHPKKHAQRVNERKKILMRKMYQVQLP